MVSEEDEAAAMGQPGDEILYHMNSADLAPNAAAQSVAVEPNNVPGKVGVAEIMEGEGMPQFDADNGDLINDYDGAENAGGDEYNIYDAGLP